MSEIEFVAAVFVLAAAHIGAFLATVILRRGPSALLAVNVAASCFVLWFIASRPDLLDEQPFDWHVVELIAFELIAIASAIAAWRRVRFALPISYVVFALHVLADIAVLHFLLTFHITRLI